MRQSSGRSIVHNSGGERKPQRELPTQVETVLAVIEATYLGTKPSLRYEMTQNLIMSIKLDVLRQVSRFESDDMNVSDVVRKMIKTAVKESGS